MIGDFNGMEGGYRYPLLSEKFHSARNGPLAVGLTWIVAGPDGYFTAGNVAAHMDLLLNGLVPFCGPDSYEVGSWVNQFSVIDDPSYSVISRRAIDESLSEDHSYYAWLDASRWDYDPSLVIYGRSEFMDVFLDVCSNFVKANPLMKEEYVAALSSLGLTKA
jgi:hypothetical protein